MKNKRKSGNYLSRIPKRNETISWKEDENGVITLEIENKGVFNTLAQKLFRKPKISYVHLDEMGSFIWPLIDGEETVYEIGQEVSEHFGEKAEPLYPRLTKYFRMLSDYGFVKMKHGEKQNKQDNRKTE